MLITQSTQSIQAKSVKIILLRPQAVDQLVRVSVWNQSVKYNNQRRKIQIDNHRSTTKLLNQSLPQAVNQLVRISLCAVHNGSYLTAASFACLLTIGSWLWSPWLSWSWWSWWSWSSWPWADSSQQWQLSAGYRLRSSPSNKIMTTMMIVI